MSRLWEKGLPLDEAIHRFTVGDDPLHDRELAAWDCLGSAAHARTLERAGLLGAEECAALCAALADIAERALRGEFEIAPELEDCHTAIESELVTRLGDVGRRIHAGRSRNDQVAVAMRLWMRDAALGWIEALCGFGRALRARIDECGDLPMPGFTHMQPAMPSSVGQWLHAHLEATLEQVRAGFDLLSRLDSCPLGSGAGFGVALGLDREYTAALLGFSRAQRSPIDVQNARGRLERYFVRVSSDVGAALEKLACDMLMLFSPPLQLIGLPDAFTTGSSIMPQKRNPDVLELLRARAASLRAREAELAWVSGKLPSSYHRDLQLTKGPALAAARETNQLLDVAVRLIGEFTPNAGRLQAAMTPELYATDAAYALVRSGRPFREAYAEIARRIAAGEFSVDPRSAEFASLGRADAAPLAASFGELTAQAKRGEAERTRLERTSAALLTSSRG